MPELRHVQVPGDALADLISRFGIVGPGPAWWLSDIVQPVSLVSSEVTLSAVTTPLLFTVTQSAGELTAAAANTRHVDTGQLNSGAYAWRIIVGSSDTAAVRGWRVRVRNAADNADIWTINLVTFSGQTTLTNDFTWTLAQNERVVVENTAGITAGIVTHARIWYTTI